LLGSFGTSTKAPVSIFYIIVRSVKCIVEKFLDFFFDDQIGADPFNLFFSILDLSKLLFQAVLLHFGMSALRLKAFQLIA